MTPVTLKDIREIFSLRKMIELHEAEEWVPRLDATRLGQMQQVVAQMAGCIEGDRYRQNSIKHFMQCAGCYEP